MSEFAVPSSSVLPPPVTPVTLLGAASPLWAYYMGAAASGIAFWWMTRWSDPRNLEAVFEAAKGAQARAFAEVEPSPSAALVPAATLASAAETLADGVGDVASDLVQASDDFVDTTREAVRPAVDGVAGAADLSTRLPTEAANEAAPLVEALAAPDLPQVLIGGEAGPVSPVLGLTSPVQPPAETGRREDATETERAKPRLRTRPPGDAKPT